MSLTPPPQTTALYGPDGRMSPAWTQWVGNVARQAGKAGEVPQATLDSITAAQTDATDAGTAAAAAQVRADTAHALIEALLAYPPLWLVGDYLQTGRDAPSADWLLCDGSAVARSDYPALYAVFNPGGGSATMFALPSIPAVPGPGSGSRDYQRTFVKAK